MAKGSIVPGVLLVALFVSRKAVELNPGCALKPSWLRVDLEIVETHADGNCGELRVDYGRSDSCGRNVTVLLI